jgi:hypothetical protein
MSLKEINANKREIETSVIETQDHETLFSTVNSLFFGRCKILINPSRSMAESEASRARAASSLLFVFATGVRNIRNKEPF